MLIFIIIVILILFIILKLIKLRKEQFTSVYYTKLNNDWNTIFPEKNRNAAGPRFFKYIIDMNVDYFDFLEYNKLYCAVSGSLISPGSLPDFVYLKELNTNNLVCGYYYRCCWPCSCDLMKYAKTTKISYNFKDGKKEFYALIIDNPCVKDDFPVEVNKSIFCRGNSINNDKIFSIGNKIVIGILHSGKLCTQDDINKIDNNEITGNKCSERNSTPLNNLEYGMGDIFIKLSK